MCHTVPPQFVHSFSTQHLHTDNINKTHIEKHTHTNGANIRLQTVCGWFVCSGAVAHRHYISACNKCHGLINLTAAHESAERDECTTIPGSKWTMAKRDDGSCRGSISVTGCTAVRIRASAQFECAHASEFPGGHTDTYRQCCA